MDHLLKYRIKQLKEKGDSRNIYQNQLDKACSQHDMAYGDFKDLNRRTASDKLLRDKAFNMTNFLKYDGYQRELASMVHKFVNERSSSAATKNEIISNRELPEELHKPIIRQLEKSTVIFYR